MAKKTQSISELRMLAKTKRKGIIYSIVDYFAYYPAKLFLYTPVTPNQITVLWIIGQLISATFLLKGDYLTTIISLLAFQSMFILDCADGIVARYKKQFSLNGKYLDNIGHYIANSYLLICFSIGAVKQYNNIIYLVFGLIAVLSFLLNKSLTLNPAIYDKKSSKLITEISNRSYTQQQNKFIVAVFNFIRLEHFLNLMFFGALLNYNNITIIIYASIFFLEMLRKILTQIMLIYRIEHRK